MAVSMVLAGTVLADTESAVQDSTVSSAVMETLVSIIATLGLKANAIIATSQA